MKKSYLLSLIIALCFTIQCWAQFSPDAGKMYALKEKSSGLYLDIQTLGIHEPGNTTNSLSLNVNPCIIYFEKGNTTGTTGTWKLKNINGTYAGNYNGTNGLSWNTKISEESYDWIIAVETDGLLTIAKDANNFIGWDNEDAITAGSALYNNAQGENTSASKIYFELVEYSYSALKLNGINGYYTLKLQEGENTFYMNFTKPGEKDDSEASLQAMPTYLHALPSANEKYLVFQNKDDATQFLSHPVRDWSTMLSPPKLWTVSADKDGLVAIRRHAADATPGNDFGTNDLLELNRLLYTNVENAHKWSFEGIFDYRTIGTEKDGNIEFKSDTIYY